MISCNGSLLLFFFNFITLKHPISPAAVPFNSLFHDFVSFHAVPEARIHPPTLLEVFLKPVLKGSGADAAAAFVCHVRTRVKKNDWVEHAFAKRQRSLPVVLFLESRPRSTLDKNVGFSLICWTQLHVFPRVT